MRGVRAHAHGVLARGGPRLSHVSEGARFRPTLTHATGQSARRPRCCRARHGAISFSSVALVFHFSFGAG
eukprot:1833066-Pyramimonas_sp.AAC.1